MAHEEDPRQLSSVKLPQRDLRLSVENEVPFLKQRIRAVAKNPSPKSSPATSACEGFVLYVPIVALRGHENPGLLAARMAAQKLGLPLVVVAPVLDTTKHFTARRLQFALEGIREMAKEVERESGGKIQFFALVTHPGRRRPAHLSLAAKARLVVTDEPFVAPFTDVVAKIRGAAKQFWQVDTSCIVPAAVAGKHYERAFHFERAVSGRRKEALHFSRIASAKIIEDDILVPLRNTKEATTQHIKGLMGFVTDAKSNPDLLSADDLQTLDIEAYVRSHQGADQTVKPVPNISRGGSTRGYDRWAQFLAKGLSTYHTRRTDPMHHFKYGCSRMSAYLNFGMVSPFRLARDLEGLPSSDGKRKYLDEFYKWRGVSYNHAYYSPQPPHSHTALPEWSRTTLDKHAGDPKTEYTIDELERCQTDSVVWNEMQRFLEATGELHNNCRMSWGRAIIAWSHGAEDTMHKLVHLNDKFALDGLSPPSYAGLGWCLGLFDKPHSDIARYGKIRPRNVNMHKIKTKLEEYRTLANEQTAQNLVSPGRGQQARLDSFFRPSTKRIKTN
mmetsp:Transcript_36/g.124  ORF Transcript_36/g.124 Transcript_36/m.124 type:complete len:557 (-) Transcript_36:1166-2836(-)|eukprot:CAMPEP_0171496426 /NCGR_PEP_ID=MMETSP0958-20121227/6698_1 /TAXON_ID=87120 /ORGANISM="Aurantiochytrium limacinum, Strain ATCCMYA-1381" /LENGTH=556 /DNA_ID=CAMNT_0012030533 /DNA_START=230 /DNA_END=1900 /DNA_ORIENTATION=+